MQISIIYCWTHPKAIDHVSLGKNQVDKQVKEAARIPCRKLLPNIFLGKNFVKKNITLGKSVR
jgi:hypothetical protein